MQTLVNTSPKRSSTMSIVMIGTLSTYLNIRVEFKRLDTFEVSQSDIDRRRVTIKSPPETSVRKRDCTNAVGGVTDMESCKVARPCRRSSERRHDSNETSPCQLRQASSQPADRTQSVDDANE